MTPQTPQNPHTQSHALRLAVMLTIAHLLYSASAVAQSTADVHAPVIELEVLAESPADRTQVFTALVADDRQKLKDVTLYHRRTGQLPFVPARMTALGSTGYFSVSIATETGDLRAMEYYIQARDESGNRTVAGFAFDPYRRTITEANAPAIVTTTAPAEKPLRQSRWSGNTRRIIAVALGVLAVGALASLSDSGTDGSDPDAGNSPGDITPSRVPLTINISEP